VPGLLMAAPFLAVGLVAMGSTTLAVSPARMLAGLCAVYAVAVAITQYRQAGGIEWGARYLALILPLLVPVAVFALSRALARLDGELRRAVTAALVATTVLMSVLGISTIRSFHDSTRRFAEALDATVAQVQGPDLGDGDRRPIVVTTWFVVGKLTAGAGPSVRGLTVVPREDLRSVVERLHAAGVPELAFVTLQPQELQAFDGRYRVRPGDNGGGNGGGNGAGAAAADERIYRLERL
jgi:hypothetical protein